MKIITVIFTSLAMASTVYASTFVGNGGNAGDVELQVTKNQIIEVFQYIEKHEKKPLELCTCTQTLEGHGTCEILNRLSDEQRLFCADFVSKKSTEIVKMMKLNQINFRWTHDDIDVEESSGPRAADAVANAKRDEITINKNRFLEMKSYERLFLLGHEVFHLVGHDGKPIADEQEIGPFKTKDGGRQLLNAVGATLAMESFDSGINQRYQSPLTRSRARENWWINLYSGSSNLAEADSVFHQERMSGGGISLRYDFYNNLGVYLASGTQKGEKSILSTIKATETRSHVEYGLTYKLIPFADPLSFLGQSYFLANIGGLSSSGTYSLKDSSLDETESSVSTGWTIGCSYYMPIHNGFWIFAQGSLMNYNHKYTFGSAGSTVEYKKPHGRYTLGVSYGF